MRAYKILQDPYSRSRLTVHPDCAESLGLLEKKRCIIRFGNASKEVDVILDTDLTSKQVGLSEQILWDMRLPRITYYDIRIEGDEYRFGPYLAILAAATREGLRLKLESLKSFVHSYEDILGAFLVFSLDGVDLQKSTIEGYLYNPDTGGWVIGTYAYPDAVLSIVELSLTNHWKRFIEVMDHLKKELHHRVFNYPIFNKMEMHHWLSNYPEINNHLPETIHYKGPEDIVNMLKRHRKIYIKPITGRLAMGIIEASRVSSGLLVKYRLNRRNQSKVFKNYAKLCLYLKGKLTPGMHLIQQGLNLISDNGRIIDFRVMLLKGDPAEWKNIGVFSRYGERHSIVSNITAGGLAGMGEKTIRKVLRVGHQEADEWIQKMNDLSITCAKAMEEYGIHGGNFGLDLAIDTERKLWLIEINNQNPDPYIAVSAGRRDIFLEARKTNMLYLRCLAGFSTIPPTS